MGEMPDRIPEPDPEFLLAIKEYNATPIGAIELAIAANGGPEYRQEACTCDREVGWQCEYCTIREGLRAAHHALSKKTE